MKAMIEALSDMRNGTCKWCRTKNTLVFRDNRLCEDCESRTIYCSICRARCSEDSKCRHVFYADYCCWSGAGVYPNGDPDMKRPVHRLLSALGEDFARDLIAAISSGKFHTWFVAPMIGGGGIITLYGMPPEKDWGEAICDMQERANAETLVNGYKWLVSLYDRDTLRANRATVGWIEEWLWPFSRLERRR